MSATVTTVGVDKQKWAIATALFTLTSALRLWFVAWMSDKPLREALLKWDASIYADIANYGYFRHDGTAAASAEVWETRLAFFPGLPGLMRAIGQVTGLDVTTAGYLIVTVAGIAMTAAAITIAEELGADLRGRWAAAILILGAPMSITFNMVYTEAPFLALSLWALVAMLRKQWAWAACAVFFASFFRLTAIDLWLTLLIAIGIYARSNIRAWAMAIASSLPLFAYLGYASSYTRDVGGYFGLQKKGWHSSFDFGVATWRWSTKQLQTTHDVGYIVSILTIVAAVGACFFAFRRLPWALWIFGTGVVANVVLSDGIMHSRPRLLLPAIVLLLPAALRAARLARRDLILISIAWLLSGAWISAHMLVVFQWAI